MTSTATARNLVGPLIRMGYRVRLTGAHHCPRRGPLLVVAPYQGVVDPTMIATCLPRPVDVLVDPGALSTLGGRLPGRIVIAADDPGQGLTQARAVLDAGGAVGAWAGEGRERAAGYLCAQTTAPVLPAVVFGGSGRHPGDPPSWRAHIDIVIGEPFEVPMPPDPLAVAGVHQVGELIRQRVADHVAASQVRMGRADGVAVEAARLAADNGAL